MTTTMWAVRAETFGAPEVLRPARVAVPEPGPGQVLIRVEAAAVNYSDVMRRRASPYPFPTSLPYTPGGEVAGTVEALGEGVSGLDEGMPVFAVVGEGGESGYAQFALARAASTTPLPPGMDPHVACGLLVAGATAVLLLTDASRLQAEESVLVQAAAGGVGSLAVQIAKAMGAGTVVAAASTPAKRRLALQLGADHTLDYTRPDWPQQLAQQLPGGVDVILDMVGGASLEQSLGCLAPFGRVVVYGSASPEPRSLSQGALGRWLSDPALGQTVSSFNLGAVFAHRPERAGRAIGTLMELIGSGQVTPRIGHVLPLSRAAEAHALLEERRSSGKIVLRPWPDAEGRVVHEASTHHFELGADGSVLTLRWSADTQHLSVEQFQQAISSFADAAVTYRPRGLLVDVRELRYEGGPPPTEWRDEHIVPLYLSAGAVRLAYVSSGLPRRVAAIDTPLAERWFDDEAAALDWLGGTP
ncbi:MAG: zinc-binding dehydrogenase [Myxococcales bacterium]|nr:zinc-binding dehydrogenase [Myxococcales bacterium]